MSQDSSRHTAGDQQLRQDRTALLLLVYRLANGRADAQIDPKRLWLESRGFRTLTQDEVGQALRVLVSCGYLRPGFISGWVRLSPVGVRAAEAAQQGSAPGTAPELAALPRSVVLAL